MIALKPSPGFTEVWRSVVGGLTYVVGLDQCGAVKTKIFGASQRSGPLSPPTVEDARRVLASAHRLCAVAIESGFYPAVNGEVFETGGRNVALLYWEPSESWSQSLGVDSFKAAIRALKPSTKRERLKKAVDILNGVK